MKLILDSSFLIYTLGIPRGTSPTEILSFASHLPQKPDIKNRIPSKRFFDEAQMVCAELELAPEEKIVPSEIEIEANVLGWCVADAKETAAFIFQIPPGFPSKMPASLLGDFIHHQGPRKNSQTALRFERHGWDRQATFDLTVADLSQLGGQHHVLLIRKYQEEE